MGVLEAAKETKARLLASVFLPTMFVAISARAASIRPLRAVVNRNFSTLGVNFTLMLQLVPFMIGSLVNLRAGALINDLQPFITATNANTKTSPFMRLIKTRHRLVVLGNWYENSILFDKLHCVEVFECQQLSFTVPLIIKPYSLIIPILLVLGITVRLVFLLKGILVTWRLLFVLDYRLLNDPQQWLLVCSLILIAFNSLARLSKFQFHYVSLSVCCVIFDSQIFEL